MRGVEPESSGSARNHFLALDKTHGGHVEVKGPRLESGASLFVVEPLFVHRDGLCDAADFLWFTIRV